MSRRSTDRDGDEGGASNMLGEMSGLLSSVVSPKKKRSSGSRDGGSGGGAPTTMADRLATVIPILLKIEEAIAKLIDFLTPWVERALLMRDQFMDMLEPYGPNEIMQMLTGVSLMFFGGFFITTIAVVEALDQGGREAFTASMRELHAQATSVREANEADDVLDEDNDGVADVEQISKTELTMRKMALFLRSCNPEKVSAAFGQLYAIMTMVTATLQVKFARAISLGVSIGNVLSKTILKAIGPAVQSLVDEAYYPWVPVVLRYVCRLIGVSIAFSVQRVLSTVHTALRGARMATDGFTAWCEARDLHYLSDGYLDDAAAFVLAFAGIYGQLFLWSKLPMIIKLVLFPATFTEWLLTFLVSVQVSRGTTTASQQQAFNKPGAM